MIRRKLTRIEVTLDDTKDLDEFFTKASQANNIGTLTTPNFGPKSLATIYPHKQLGFTPLCDVSLEQATSIRTEVNSNTLNNTNTTTATVTSANNNIPTESATAANDQQQESAERPLFNPQPYNQSSRFN